MVDEHVYLAYTGRIRNAENKASTGKYRWSQSFCWMITMQHDEYYQNNHDNDLKTHIKRILQGPSSSQSRYVFGCHITSSTCQYFKENNFGTGSFS